MASEPNWEKAAADAMANLEGGHGRVYPPASSLAVIDDVVAGLNVTEIVAKRGFKLDLIETALGHVTTVVHGIGRVPDLADGGWYQRQGNQYVVAPGFAAAWRGARLV